MPIDRSTLVSAAGRHVLGAHRLLEDSPDQAWHLAGYGPECARKACLHRRWFDKILGHDFSERAEEVIEWALALDARAARYGPHGWEDRYAVLGRWNVQHRYWKTGTAEPGETRELVDQATEAVLQVATRLWADGLI